MVMVMGSSTQALLHLLHAAQWLAGEGRLQVSMEWRGVGCSDMNFPVAIEVTCVEVLRSFSEFHWQLALRPAFQHFPILSLSPASAQHLCVNLFHLMDALDLEGVPDLEMSSEPQNLAELHLGWSARPHLDRTFRGPGVPLKCTRDGPVASICYPDIGIGWNNAGAQGHKECQVGNEEALIGLVGLALVHTIGKKPC